MSHRAEPRVAIRVLGPVEVTVRGAPLEVDTRKAVALLVYLALAGRPVDREALAALLWPEADGSDARGAFRRTLSVLNAGLGPGALRIDRRAVALETGAVAVDVLRFRAALDRVRAHAHAPDETCASCLGDLEAAASLDRGELLAGFALRDSEEWDAWQRAETESHRRDLAAVLERLARTRAGAGDHRGAIEAARRWVALDPLHEPAQRVLIAALAAAGETGAAIRQYRNAVATLDRELGVEPLAETTALYEAIRDGTFVAPAAAASVAAMPAIPPARLPFVGRERELSVLLAAHRTAAPDGSVAILDGPPGIGKTRLAEELVAAVRAAGGSTLVATCYRGEQGIAFAAIADLLRDATGRPAAAARLAAVPVATRVEIGRLVPALLPPGAPPSPTTDPGARTRLLDAVASSLAALVTGPTPGLVVVDDLQWADGSTLEALTYLARRLAGRPLLLLLVLRREDLADAALAAVRTLERQRGVSSISLAGLGEPAVVELVVAAGAGPDIDAAALTRESEGLPLFVVEALAAPRPGGGAPAGVRALLDERTEGVGEVAGQVLVAAAVLGRSTDLAALRGTSGRSEEEAVAAVEELVARGLVRETSGPTGDPVYDLAHAMLRDVVLDRTSLARRRLLHRRAAETLRAADPRTPDLARLARIAVHERAAGRYREAARAHREAGDLARSLYANREAIDHLEAALALDHEDPGAIHEALGELRTRTGEYSAAVASLERAAATAPPGRLPSIERRLALAHQRLGDHGAAASHLLAALALLGPDDGARARIEAEQAVVALGAGDPVAAAAHASAVLGRADEDAVAAAHAHRVLGLLAAARGDTEEARAALEASLALARLANDPGLAIAAHNALALVAAAAGNAATALEHGSAALAEARRTGDLHLEAAVESNLGDVLHAAGRDEESRAHQLRAAALFAEVGGRPGELQPEIWKLSAW
jgi:DNA-binding SARP family transcriptional activator